MKVVLCTAPVESAESLAFSLIEARVAACVNLLPKVRSVYRWKGAVESADETLLVIKTGDETLPALMERVTALHPYDVPEIVALEVHEANARYVEWVDSTTRKSEEG